MNDPRRTERFGPPLTGSGQTDPRGPRNPPPADPAYAGQAPYAPYAPPYGGYPPQWTQGQYEPDTTYEMPQYWQEGAPPPSGAPQNGPTTPPEGPKSPRWLWFAAGAAVLLVVGLLIALVIANGSAQRQTAVPPLPAMSGPSSTNQNPTTKRPRSPSAAPPTNSSPGTRTETTDPAAMQTVVYDITGEGRAISVTYLDTGNVIQTEFNVALPWHKEVSLSTSAVNPASVTIVNIGHDITCSLTVAGVQVRQRTGVGLTICNSPG